MKIYDISQEVFSCAVYPGDPKPEKQTVYSTGAGDLYNLSFFAMCAHNGTHVDAPFHFLHDGKTVDQIDLSHFVGDCFVARHEGDVTAADAENILKKADGAERILIAGNATVLSKPQKCLQLAASSSLATRDRQSAPKTHPCRYISSCCVGKLPFWRASYCKVSRRVSIS